MNAPRVVAVAAVAVSLLAAWLSFTALSDLAQMHGIPSHQSAAFPLTVDGLVIVSTVAAATLQRSRWYAWSLLVAGTVVSVAGNGIHAWMTTGSVVAVGIAILPPLVNLAAIHLAIHLATERRTPATIEVEETAAVEIAEPEPATSGARMEPEESHTASSNVAAISPHVEALRLVESGMSKRAVAAQLGVSDTTVRRWLKAAA